jgi:serine/threonine-protein kinase
MANRGNPREGVDPTAATLFGPEKQTLINPQAAEAARPQGADHSVQLTLVDRKAKLYSRDQKHPKPVEAGQGLEVQGQEFVARYQAGKRLGEGSMGEVIAARDTRILRNVAMKRLHVEHHNERPDLRDRFLREARVQGQLEHPSVVPVYDLGVDHEGREYFTMKRVRGNTLEQIIRGLRDKDPEFTSKFSRRKLLTAMSRICLAVAFAHERGVVHRDLKPSNIMLGDYGEVHRQDHRRGRPRGR